MTDSYTDELFAPKSEYMQTVVFPVSRLALDPERFEDDAQEVMAERGMGVIYARTSDGLLLREAPTENERKILIERYYKPHHLKLQESVDVCLQSFGRCVIFDCHSFPSVPLPYEDDQNPDRPDICIGTDEFHTPDALCQILKEAVARNGLSCEINRPFSGSIVPGKYYRRNSNVNSIMFEVNRGLYMNEKTGEKGVGFEKHQKTIGAILELLRMEYERIE